MAEPRVKTPPIQVLALTKYGRLGASSRCRFLNYIPLLNERNITVSEAPLLSDAYVKQRLGDNQIDYVDVSRSYLARLAAVADAPRFDVLWIEGELLPRWPAAIERLLPLLGRHYVVDLDDAIFHTYDRHPSRLVRALLGRKIDAVFKSATTVVAGNQYLGERAKRAGAKHVMLVPTAVDHRRYPSKSSVPDKLTFGWIGSPATAHYLRTIAREIEELCRSLPARLHLIGVERHGFTCPDVILSPWSEETEVEELAACDIGLAPMPDGPWERGKCGLKAIQYMASGIPVLAADVGVLPNIVRHGETGFIYRDGAEFTRYTRELAADSELRRRIGAAGRERVAAHYSIHGWADSIAEVLTAAASPRPKHNPR